MIGKDYTKNSLKPIDKRSSGIVVSYRCCLLFVLLLVSLNQVKAQLEKVVAEDIKFESVGVSLAGTLYMPENAQAAVVLVHGSGQAPRMGDFASLLAKNGILVFTYDKRGVGESGGTYAGPEVGTNNVASANLDLLAEDASNAVNVLCERVKDLPVGLVGFSQAGWKIPLAANKNPRVEFMVLFSGAVIPTLDQLVFQFITDGNVNFWDNHTEAEVYDSMPKLFEQIRENPAAYKLDQFVSTDPRDALGKLSIPGLWLFGQKDIQIPIGVSVEVLNALKVQGKPYEYCLFSTFGHDLTSSSSDTAPVDIAIQWIKARKYCLRSK